ncbi:molybdopterin synthase sulfur carrier subunit [Burkholderia cenocepacia]|nr:molybdopterin synthase sulfur carrier subunit [Burkholderia cenocepacia]
MKLTIKYFASIREQLALDEETVEIDARELTVDALRGTLAARDARSADALRMDRPVRAAVNLEMVTGEFVVREDSEVAFFPPVTGDDTTREAARLHAVISPRSTHRSRTRTHTRSPASKQIPGRSAACFGVSLWMALSPVRPFNSRTVSASWKRKIVRPGEC